MRTIFVSLTHARARANAQHQEISFKRNENISFHSVNDHGDVYFLFHTQITNYPLKVVWKEKKDS